VSFQFETLGTDCTCPVTPSVMPRIGASGD
jgi:hypothetical protein